MYYENTDLLENEFEENNPFYKEVNQFEPDHYYTINNPFMAKGGDFFFEEEDNNENNVCINNNFLCYEEVHEKKSQTERNSDDKTAPSTKYKEGKIFEISKNFEKKNMVGRKKKNNLNGKHDKFSYDNVTRKVKTKLFDSILSFLNSSMKEVTIENPKNQKKKNIKPFFLKIEQKIIKENKVEDNKLLFKNKLKDIFSNDVSKKVESYGLDYNKKLIKKIYKENVQTKAIEILERTFGECLEHFRGSKYYKELEGLEKEYKNVLNEFRIKGETEEYIELFEELLGRFEGYYENKKARPKKDNKEK